MTEKLVSFIYTGPGNARLDKVLAAYLSDYSRTRLQVLIKNGLVQVGDEIVKKTGFQVEPGSSLRVQIPAVESVELKAEPIPLDILYENRDLLIINKPAGMVVHPSAGHSTGTLVQAALAHAPEMEGVGGKQRPGIVHRLDKDTSGLILIAKNDRTHRWLQEQFKQREVKKAYIALVDGQPPTPEGKIDAPIARDPNQRKKMAVVAPGRGRDAVSEYFTLETFEYHALLEVHPLTGRTHQIRLHLAFLKCPVAGDRIYGRRKASLPLDRHFLHAARLTLRLPGEPKPRSFEAPLSEDLVQILDQLRRA